MAVAVEEKTTKKRHTGLLVTLIVILILGILIGGGAAWYFLRPTYSWDVSEDGVLTVSGITVLDTENKRLMVTGAVPQFEGGAPWDKKNDRITAVTVSEDITALSDNAFAGLTNVTTLELPKALGWEGIDTITVPAKDDHSGSWDTAEKGKRVTYTAAYRRIFTITFEADGKVVQAVDYLEGDETLTEPPVPKKDGWVGAWPEYTLDGDATVTAVYTYAIQTAVTTTKVNIHSEAGADTKTIGTLSKGMEIALLEEADKDGTKWYRMSIGWVCGDYLSELTYVGSGLAAHMGITADEGVTISDETAAAVLTGISLLTAREFDVAFVLTDLETGLTIRYNDQQEFYAASTIKGPYVVSVVDRSPSAATDFWGTIQEILVNSSNDDYYRLRNTYGKKPLELWCEAAGVDLSVTEKYYPSINADQLCRLWVQNYHYFTTDENGEKVAKWFQKPDKSPIHATLSGKYTTQTKAGWIEGTTDYYQAASDAGIVYAESGPYAVAILSNGRSNLKLLNTLVEALDTLHTEMK